MLPFPVRPKMSASAGIGSSVSTAMTPKKPAAPAGNFPVKPRQLGTMSFNNLKPPQAATGNHMGTTSLAGTSPKIGFPVKPVMPAAGAPAAPGKGYSAYMDEQLGGAGWKMGTRDAKSGFVAQDGAYKGKTRQEATAGLRDKFLAMSPEERAKYDSQAEVLGGTAGRPEAAPSAPDTAAAQHSAVLNRQPAGPAVAGIEDPAMDDDEDMFTDDDEDES